jgi:cysteine desulfurase
MGCGDLLARSAIRFSIGRFTTEADVDHAIKLCHEKIQKLRDLSPLWDMYKEGIDLSTVQWTAH